MSLILCPECGSKISDKATACPHCGYVSIDSTLPISAQNVYEVVPSFSYEIEEWKPNCDELDILGVEDNKNLVQYFGNWQNIRLRMPALAKVIRGMAKKDKILAAKMDSYVKTLIDKGVYKFTIDKKGEILPTIRDSEGFVKQVRLEEMTISPELSNSLNNLTTHAAMAQILDEIEYVGDAIKGIHIELQNDRVALAESARDKLVLASKIQDTKLREIAVLDAVSAATEAKCVLMKNFSENLQFIIDNSGKNDLELFIEHNIGKTIPQKTSDAFQDLVLITNAVQIECQGYAILGEYGSSKESLLQFKSFINKNNLDNKDILLLLNENTPQKKAPIVDQFALISKRITSFDNDSKITAYNKIMIMEDGKDEDEGKE